MGLIFYARKSLPTNTNSKLLPPLQPQQPATQSISIKPTSKPLTLRNRIFLKSLVTSFRQNE